nr:glycosyl hydrolase [Pseudalgibacter alginicilyticus]
MLLFCIAISSCVNTQVSKTDTLKSGFTSPPREAKPLVWWDWVNGNVTKEGIKADLLDMKRVGIGGAQLFDLEVYMPKGPVRYGTDDWFEHVNYAMHIADSLGLEFHVMNCPGWSASGGPWNTPEKSMKQIVWSETHIEGGGEQIIELPLPEIKHDYFEDIAVLAVPVNSHDRLENWENKIAFSKTPLKRDMDSKEADNKAIQKHQVLNLSTKLSDDGMLTCNLPAGNWIIMRFGFTSTGSTNHPAVPEGHGLECDKLDVESVKFQFDKALGRIIKNAQPYLGSTFKGLVFDSFEGGYQNWTKDFPNQFERINGYDLTPYLPILAGVIIDSKVTTEAILYDFRGTIDKLIAENYFKTMQDLAHENKLVTYAESQGGPLNPFTVNEYVDVPMNEFWLRNYIQRVPLMKQSAASAHLYNKSVVGAESFTAIPEYGKWQSTPFTLKRAGDCAFTAGINRFIFHTYIHQPYDYLKPGFTMGRYGTHFGRQSAWWAYAKDWIDYISRSQFLLQQGKTITDIGVLLSNDMRYDIPGGDIKAPLGYDLTMAYPQHLDNSKVVNGVIELSDLAHCEMLVLNDRSSYMDIATLKNLYRLVNEGAIIAGKPPMSPPGYKEIENSMDEFNELVDKIWGGLDDDHASKSIGKGKVWNTTNLDKIVTITDLKPDLEFIPNQQIDSLRYIHKKIDDTDVYFVTNLSSALQSVKVSIRITGKKPELWDAATGKTSDVPIYKVSNSTEIPFNLEAGGSRFIVFRDKLPSKWIAKVEPDILETLETNYLVKGDKQLKIVYSDDSIKTHLTKECSEPMDLSKSWQVTFIEGRGAPSEAVAFESLMSWTEHSNEDIKYYSGIAEYAKTFTLPNNYINKGQRCILKLGDVYDVAQVSINGHKPVIVWKKPAELDVTDMLVNGENKITIGVANRWINRLIGDEQIETDILYREGSGKFTTGVIEAFPDWMRDEQRAKEENKRHTFTTWKHYTADAPLKKSGLLGPVQLEVYNEFVKF